ncbi:hypothetical protein SAMN05421741_11822 [Paenimyroides ummariense]|uniref:Uncharacterized protein n=1 Tax=Paenimyroides ummariense TaxID=913024 RepID=A0A1I5E022_9FLAO|nr:hypothetical protein [Paenimyroides ummariense]SFO04733.1 hypothetical protein SAMN05421741_11822 [Paenimyroides ummariense]
MEIVINEKKIPLRFSYSLIRALAAKWKMTDLEVVLNKIMNALAAAEKDVFTAIDLIAEMVVEAAKLNGIEVSADDVGDVVFTDPQIITSVVEAFVNSMPKISASDAESLKKKAAIQQK